MATAPSQQPGALNAHPAALKTLAQRCPVGLLHEPQGVSDDQQEIVLLKGLVEQGHDVVRWLDAVALVIFLGEVDAKVQPAGEPRLLDMLRSSNMRC